MVTVTKGMTGHDITEATLSEVREDYPFLKDRTILFIALLRISSKYALREALSSKAEGALDSATKEIEDKRRYWIASKDRHPSNGGTSPERGGTGREHVNPEASPLAPLPDEEGVLGTEDEPDFLEGEETESIVNCPNCDSRAYLNSYYFQGSTNLRVSCPECLYTEEA